MTTQTWGWRLDVQTMGPVGPFQVVGHTTKPEMEEWLKSVRERHPGEVYRAHNLDTGEVLP